MECSITANGMAVGDSNFTNLKTKYMETLDRFKNSPIHDKSAILELMDELNPEQMAELVDYLQKRVKLLRQPPVMGSFCPKGCNGLCYTHDGRIQEVVVNVENLG